MSLFHRRAARLRRDRGQTLLLFVFFMVALILFVGLGIDVGFAYVTRASLSKAVDAASLTGARTLSVPLAKAAFHANYPQSGRDVADPVPEVTFSKDEDNNTLINVSATATISTYFIRILPLWTTLTVSSSC